MNYYSVRAPVRLCLYARVVRLQSLWGLRGFQIHRPSPVIRASCQNPPSLHGLDGVRELHGPMHLGVHSGALTGSIVCEFSYVMLESVYILVY